jgi:hypothetical protein
VVEALEEDRSLHRITSPFETVLLAVLHAAPLILYADAVAVYPETIAKEIEVPGDTLPTV